MEGRMEIIDKTKRKAKENEILQIGQIVYCKGGSGAGSFYGIVYENGIIEIPNGSTSYISTRKALHLGDTISYWTIEKVFKKVKLIIEED